MWLTKHVHARLNRGEETFPCRTKTKELSDSSVCFNAFLMLPPPTSVFLLLLLVTPAWARGTGSWGARGVCRLTWAQAAICHPTLASLILILSPAWPSRPAVSSPQKGFLLGGVELGRQRPGGAVGAGELHSEAFDLVPGPVGQTAQTDRPVSSLPPPPSPPLSFISHTDPRGWQRDRGGGGERDREEGRVVGKWTQWRDWHGLPWPLPSLLHSSLGTELSIPYGQAAALSSSPLCDPSLVCSLLYPSAATARRAPGLCIAEHAPTGHI